MHPLRLGRPHDLAEDGSGGGVVTLEKGIREPEGGWQEQTFYWVRVKVSASNVPWVGIFYSGFLGKWRDGVVRPSAYATVWEGGSPSSIGIERLWSLDVISKLLLQPRKEAVS
jgi:hypothetical protein